jgi:hypothetical protein
LFYYFFTKGDHNMVAMQGIPHGASTAIDDMLDKCARIRVGQEVLILAHIDGLHSGDNL